VFRETPYNESWSTPMQWLAYNSHHVMNLSFNQFHHMVSYKEYNKVAPIASRLQSI
jgi:hypothetical protein